MSTFKLIFNYSWGIIISIALSLVAIPLITRNLNPIEFGKSTLFLFYLNFITQIILLGIDQSFIRFYNEELKNKNIEFLFFNSIFLPIILFFIFFVITLLFHNSFNNLLSDKNDINTNDFKLIIILNLSIFFSIIERFISAFFRLKKDAFFYSLTRVITSVSNFIILIICILILKLGYISILYSNLISILLTILFAIQRIGIKFSFSYFSFYKSLQLLKYGIPFIPTFIITFVFEGIDKIFLKQFSGFYELGIFSTAFKIISILITAQSLFTTIWVPIIIEKYEIINFDFNLYLNKIFKKAYFYFYLLAILIISFLDIIIYFLGSNYKDAKYIVPLLLIIPIFYLLSEITVVGINFKKKTIFHLLISTIVAIFNVFVGYFLIKSYGALGAAFTTSLGYFFFFLLRTHISKKLLKFNIYDKDFMFSTIILFLDIGFNTLNFKNLYFINLSLFILLFFVNRKFFIQELHYFKNMYSEK
jgi:O-antigen/teichoic acid export membrane protein